MLDRKQIKREALIALRLSLYLGNFACPQF